MRSFLLLCLLSLSMLSNISGQHAHDIEITIDGYTYDTIMLSFYLGEHQYIRDTLIASDGVYHYQGSDTMPAGVYNLLLQPTNHALQILVDEDQDFSVRAKWEDEQLKDVTFDGSVDNELYYEYVSKVQQYKPVADSLKNWINDHPTDDDGVEQAQDQWDEIDEMIRGLSMKIQQAHPARITSAILRLNNPIDVPEYDHLDDEAAKQARFEYYRQAYLDHTQLDDPRLFRSPYLKGRITNLIDRLTVQIPDSVNVAIDEVMNIIESTGDADYYQYYLVHFMNTFAKTRIVGFDAVYVHLAEEYYGKGKAPWMDKKQLAKVVGNARAMKSTLVGMTAPDVTLYDRDSTAVRIHDIDASYTVIYFWSPTCGHCKKSTPKLIAIADSLAVHDVKIVTICNKTGEEAGTCWDYIDTNSGMEHLINLNDPKYTSKFKTRYYVKSTPKVLILDRDKKIISKDIGVEQLKDVIERIVSFDQTQAEPH